MKSYYSAYTLVVILGVSFCSLQTLHAASQITRNIDAEQALQQEWSTMQTLCNDVDACGERLAFCPLYLHPDGHIPPTLHHHAPERSATVMTRLETHRSYWLNFSSAKKRKKAFKELCTNHTLNATKMYALWQEWTLEQKAAYVSHNYILNPCTLGAHYTKYLRAHLLTMNQQEVWNPDSGKNCSRPRTSQNCPTILEEETDAENDSSLDATRATST